MMRLPHFRFQVPETVDEAITQKREAPSDAAYVAGGTDLYPNMKRRHQEPSVLIALHAIDELRAIVTEADGAVSIGATATLTEVASHPAVQAVCPALVETMHLISTPILQNMGTIGGNLLLDTRCNYYDQGYEWRKAINFCMKKDGE
ncbi:MAG: FAD binding domain-containing protein, partial [Gemmatimonadetes bacterium]|nr:FAD binding domain-containing protein [Gemmatimonadota bacterium]